MGHNLISVPYLAYTFSIGKSATFQETFDAVNKFSARIISCSCVGVLLVMLCFLFAFGIATRNSQPTPQALSNAGLMLTPLSIFGCLWSFTNFGFFENDWGIRKSIDNAWNLFTSHVVVLATLGLGLVILWRVSSVIVGVATVLIQSGFDTTSLGSLNYINPSTTLGKNMLFMLMNGINQTVYNTFGTSVFVLAYLKYSGGKNRFTTR